MSGQGQTAIPNQLVATDEERQQIWYVYGRDAERNGFRAFSNPPPVIAYEMQHSQCGQLSAAAAGGDSDKTKQFAARCGPFRADYYTNPLYVEGRDTKISDMPPR